MTLNEASEAATKAIAIVKSKAEAAAAARDSWNFGMRDYESPEWDEVVRTTQSEMIAREEAEVALDKLREIARTALQ